MQCHTSFQILNYFSGQPLDRYCIRLFHKPLRILIEQADVFHFQGGSRLPFDVGSTDNQREISELSYKRSHRVSEEFCPWTPAVGNLKPWLSISFVLLLVRFIFALSELWFNFVWSLESFELLKSSSHEFWIHFLFLNLFPFDFDGASLPVLDPIERPIQNVPTVRGYTV